MQVIPTQLYSENNAACSAWRITETGRHQTQLMGSRHRLAKICHEQLELMQYNNGCSCWNISFGFSDSWSWQQVDNGWSQSRGVVRCCFSRLQQLHSIRRKLPLEAGPQWRSSRGTHAVALCHPKISFKNKKTVFLQVTLTTVTPSGGASGVVLKHLQAAHAYSAQRF